MCKALPHSLKEQVDTASDWECVAPVPLQTVCVRHTLPAFTLDEGAMDRHTLAWADGLNQSGACYVTPAILNGRWMVRISIGSEPTELADVQALWTRMQDEVAKVSS